MKLDVSCNDFRDRFIAYDREDNFSYYGSEALYNYLIEYEEGTGEEMELDVIAICCDFTEYANLEEIQANYQDIETIEDLYNATTVIKFDQNNEFMTGRTSGIIIQNY